MEYRIGDFAVITRMSIKMLRNYHDAKLLIPARIEGGSGYRYYDESQIQQARIIVTLKNWNFSLKEILEILQEYHEDHELIEIIKRKKKEIESQITKLSNIEEDLEMLLRIEGDNKTMEKKTEIILKNIEAVKIIYAEYAGAYDECGKYIQKLYKAAGRFAAGGPFNMYGIDFDPEDPEITVCLPVKMEVSKPDLKFKVLPPARVLSTLHYGPYDTIGISYQRLIDHRTELGLRQTGPFREIYKKGPGMIFTGNPKKYITEIQMEIEG